LADGADIVADHGGHAGLIDEHRWRMVFLYDLLDRLEEALLAAEDDVGLVDVGSESYSVELRSRRFGAAIIPGIAFASDRAVDEVRDVGDRLQRYLRSV